MLKAIGRVLPGLALALALGFLAGGFALVAHQLWAPVVGIAVLGVALRRLRGLSHA